MSGINFNSWTENATRLGMRIQETLAERTRDLSLTGSGAGYYDTGEDKTKNIRSQLDSGSDREKLEAMKRLIAVSVPSVHIFRTCSPSQRCQMISKGRNVSEYFAQVVKNVASPSLEVRKLVYIYLLRYAEAEPDLALLSINTFQRDLADSSPLIRAMALRVLSGIRVPTIASLIVLAIKKCAADTSPYVRKAAALSIPKCYRCVFHYGGNSHREVYNRLQQLRRVSTPISHRDLVFFTARPLPIVRWQRCDRFRSSLPHATGPSACALSAPLPTAC